MNEERYSTINDVKLSVPVLPVVLSIAWSVSVESNSFLFFWLALDVFSLLDLPSKFDLFDPSLLPVCSPMFEAYSITPLPSLVVIASLESGVSLCKSLVKSLFVFDPVSLDVESLLPSDFADCSISFISVCFLSMNLSLPVTMFVFDSGSYFTISDKNNLLK